VPLAKILLHCHPLLSARTNRMRFLRREIAILPRGCDLCECGDNKEILTVNIDRGLMQVGRYFVFGLLQW
jgi:hypothetical protein